MITENTPTVRRCLDDGNYCSRLGNNIILPFYHFIIKPKQHEKAKSKVKGRKVVEFTVPDQDGNNRPDGANYDQIINDFPTFFTQDGVSKHE